MADESRAHKLIFSDGFMCKLLDVIPVVSQAPEIPQVTMRFTPTASLSRRYNIGSREVGPDGVIDKVVVKNDLKPINMTPGFETWLLLSNYDGSRSGIIELLDQDNLRRIGQLEEENLSLQAQVGRLQELVRKAVTDPSHFMKTIISDIDQIKKITGDVKIEEGTALMPMQGAD